MDTQTLNEHFNDCGLPLQFVEENPHRLPAWQFRHEQPNFTKFFYADVLNNATPRQRFRMFLHPDAECLMLGKNPHSRHMLVQVQCPSPNPHKPEKQTMLFGHDERQLFVVNTNRAKTVEDALESLKPGYVRWAEQRGRKVIRQGDWFFVPMPVEFEPPQEALRFTKALIGGNQSNTTQRGHVAEHQAVISDRWMWDGRRHVKVGYDLFVTGKIRHPEHSTVELIRWYRPIANQPSAHTGFIGYAD